jgi:hypothetical protein
MHSIKEVKDFVSKHATKEEAERAAYILDRMKEELSYYENLARHQDERIRDCQRHMQELNMKITLLQKQVSVNV